MACKKCRRLTKALKGLKEIKLATQLETALAVEILKELIEKKPETNTLKKDTT